MKKMYLNSILLFPLVGFLALQSARHNNELVTEYVMPVDCSSVGKHYRHIPFEIIDQLIAIHEQINPGITENWLEEAKNALNIEDEQVRLHALNTLIAIFRIDQSRNVGDWSNYFDYVGHSPKKIGAAIDLAVHVLEYWDDFQGANLLYSFVMDNNLPIIYTQKWVLFAETILQIQAQMALLVGQVTDEAQIIDQGEPEQLDVVQDVLLDAPQEPSDLPDLANILPVDLIHNDQPVAVQENLHTFIDNVFVENVAQSF